MSRAKPTVVVLWLACLMAQLPAAAQATAPAPVASLAQALEFAWMRTPVARALSHRHAEAGAALRVAEGWTPAPATIGVSSLNDRLNARAGRQEWEVEVATPLWLPGQRDAQHARALSQQTLLAAQSGAQRWDLAGQVREAWWQLALARAGVDAAARRLESAQALQADVERRWRAGDLARTDANLAQAEAQSARIEWLAAQRERDRAQAAWQALTGAVAPDALPEETPAPMPATLDAHPGAAAAGASVQAAKARLRLAERSQRDAPELALRWVRERDAGIEPYANRVGVQLRIPLSSEPRSMTELSSGRAELAEAETTLDRLREQIARDARRVQQELETATQSLALARTRAQLAADTLALMQKSFALGESDLITLLRVRADALAAEAELARQTLARAAAISRLNQTHGAMP